MLSDRIPAFLKWTHESSGHAGANATLKLFKQWFHYTWTEDQLQKTLQPIMDKCPYRSCKTWGYQGQGSLLDSPCPALRQQYSLRGLHGDA